MIQNESILRKYPKTIIYYKYLKIENIASTSKTITKIINTAEMHEQLLLIFLLKNASRRFTTYTHPPKSHNKFRKYILLYRLQKIHANTNLHPIVSDINILVKFILWEDK